MLCGCNTEQNSGAIPLREGRRATASVLRIRPLARDVLALGIPADYHRKERGSSQQSVLPLPFHAMSRYPYPAGERYPDDEAHRAYIREYLTRPALRLLRPLLPGELSPGKLATGPDF
jgi:hypothetical protein